MASAFKGWENSLILQNSGSLPGLSARTASPGFCVIVSLLSCSGDKEAEGVLSEVGHGGARRHQRRPLQHEDPPGPAKRYDPLTCSSRPPSEGPLLAFRSFRFSLQLEPEGSDPLLWMRVVTFGGHGDDLVVTMSRWWR